MTLPERFEVIAACMFVDHVMVNIGDEDSKPAILASGASIIGHGDLLPGGGNNWDHAGLLRQMRLTEEWLDEHRIVLRHLPYTPSVSTSEILNRAWEADREPIS